MAALWRLEGCCYISRTVAGLHKVLLFIVSKGQASKDFPYTKRDWPSWQSTGAGKKKSTAPTTGRIQQHFAASSARQLMENFVKAMDLTGPTYR